MYWTRYDTAQKAILVENNTTADEDGWEVTRESGQVDNTCDLRNLEKRSLRR
jgi:hypothetical protein